MSKIGIIGIGHVGSHVASAILQQGLCDTLVLIDKDEKKAIAHGYDLVDASLYYPIQAKIKCNDYSELKDADIVVISVAGSIVCESRLKETQTSIECCDEVIPLLLKSGFHGIVLSITNPCDIVANYIALKTGLNVIGSGTTLDSSRLKTLIAIELGINPNSVNAFMLGEHGDSQFPYLSNANVCGKPISEFKLDLNKIVHQTRFRAVPIFDSKHCTEFGIGTCAAKLIKAILTDSKELLPVSYFVDNYGVNHVYLSLPCFVGKSGVISRPDLSFTNEELAQLLNCSNVIQTKLKEFLK